jgi:hypothetical protein
MKRLSTLLIALLLMPTAAIVMAGCSSGEGESKEKVVDPATLKPPEGAPGFPKGKGSG